MYNFIKTQYQLYKAGQHSIGIEKIKILAKQFLTEEQQAELFGE